MAKKRQLDNLDNLDLLIKTCLDKLDGLNDYSWEDIVRMFNLSMHPDHLRKSVYGMAIYRDYAEANKDLNDKTTLKRYRQVVGNLEAKRQKVNKQKRELNRLKKDFNVAMAVSEELKEYYDENGLELFVDDYGYEDIEESDYKAVVCVSDWHIGAIINCGDNHYNLEVAKERIKKYYKEVCRTLDIYGVKEVYLMCLGDNCEHYLMRPTQPMNCELTLAEQVAECQKLIFEFACNLSKKAKVHIGMVRGNHSRMSENRNNDIAENSVDVIINNNIQYMVDLIGTDRIDVLPTNYQTLDVIINDLQFRFLHGDAMARDSRKALRNVMSVDPDVDVVVRGHFHAGECIADNNGNRIITCGTLQGHNQYSVSFGCSAVASQSVIIVGKEDIEAVRDIQLS